jgi:hypothetical protein
MLFKYPEIKDIMDIIKLAKKVEQAIDERLNGKNSNIYDIFGIMKPIESEPSHLFSPHMYNQTNKTNSSINNNISNNKININNSNNIENNNKINEKINYEKFEEDEQENINLDSINHNNDNDLGSQAKTFFNNALSSLSNFGGIIKDQLQNAKDTVIDSLKGNDSNNNNVYNNNNYSNNYNNDYEENNNYQQQNYNENDNYNNLSSSNNNNYINNEVQNENEQQSEDNGEMRKGSIDSQNDVGYNRQDIIDIVGKLKEIDTKYNMFFNVEDKKNLRIIIDYLKKKV